MSAGSRGLHRGAAGLRSRARCSSNRISRRVALALTFTLTSTGFHPSAKLFLDGGAATRLVRVRAYRFNPAVQFTTTMIGADAACSDAGHGCPRLLEILGVTLRLPRARVTRTASFKTIRTERGSSVFPKSLSILEVNIRGFPRRRSNESVSRARRKTCHSSWPMVNKSHEVPASRSSDRRTLHN